MTGLPEGLHEFLETAGWGGAAIDPIPGDASFRRYFRIHGDNGPAMLMHAPPPEEDVKPFVHVTQWLHFYGARAPEIYAEDPQNGWLLLEDFGNDRMRDWLDENPDNEERAYAVAVDAIAELRHASMPLALYDMSTYQREAGLFIEWYCSAVGLSVDTTTYKHAWTDALSWPLARMERFRSPVLRDYHAENIMLIGPEDDRSAKQGLIDYQDALEGHAAYDLVSLLQDARRDVPIDLERKMFRRYIEQAGIRDAAAFEADYAILGAQRNAKIVGIFTRLYKRDGKPRYLSMIPRVWNAMERDLQHPALAPVANWFKDNIPQELRDTHGGTIA